MGVRDSAAARQTLIAVLCTLCVARMARSSASAVTLHVHPNGSDADDCSALHPCASFSAAVARSDLISSVDDVLVLAAAGDYDERSCNVSISKNMRLVGAGRDSTVINCHGRSRAFQAIGAFTDLTIANLSVINGFADERHPGHEAGVFGGCIFVWPQQDSNASLAGITITISGLRLQNCEIHMPYFEESDTVGSWSGGAGLAVHFHGSFNDTHVVVENSEFAHTTGISDFIWTMAGGGLLVSADAGDFHRFNVFVENCNATDGWLTSGMFAEGGGIALSLDGTMHDTNVVLSNLIITDNAADWGKHGHRHDVATLACFMTATQVSD